MAEGIEAIHECQEFIKKNKSPDLVITDVPIETKKLFYELANSEKFRCEKNKGGHFGFALAFLLNFYISCNGTTIAELESKIDYCLEQLAKPKEEKAEGRVIRLLNGKELKVN